MVVFRTICPLNRTFPLKRCPLNRSLPVLSFLQVLSSSRVASTEQYPWPRFVWSHLPKEGLLDSCPPTFLRSQNSRKPFQKFNGENSRLTFLLTSRFIWSAWTVSGFGPPSGRWVRSWFCSWFWAGKPEASIRREREIQITCKSLIFRALFTKTTTTTIPRILLWRIDERV